MRAKESPAVSVEQQYAGAVGSAEIARIRALASDGTPELDLGNEGQNVPARLGLVTSRERLEAAVVLQQQVVVVFERGDRARPIIIGFIERPGANGPLSVPVEHTSVEADVDGKRVKVTAQEEIVLQCGSASITLRRNGRVIVRGTYVETHSDGTNRIKGGQVQIN